MKNNKQLSSVVMVRVLISCVVDREFYLWSGQTRLKTIRMVFFASPVRDKIYHYPPTHAKTQNTFWLPMIYFGSDMSKSANFFRFVDKRAIYRWYNLIRTCAGECD
jgi:hypothetical protein